MTMPSSYSCNTCAMNAEPLNAAQATYWNDVGGPHWVRQQHQFDMMLAGFGSAALDTLDPQPGERIIDIGCGTGTTSLAIAEAVGPSGAVLGCDIAQTMIDAARSCGAGVAQLSFEVRDAQTDDLAAGGPAFDAMFSRYGVMFFADPVAAFTNIGASVRSGGRLTFVCWQPEDQNPWLSVPAAIMQSFTPNPVLPLPNTPGPFAFRDPDRIREILTGGGWNDIGIDPCIKTTVMGGGDGIDAALSQVMGTAAGSIMRQQVDDETFDLATQAVRAVLVERFVDGSVVFEGSAWVVTARRP